MQRELTTTHKNIQFETRNLTWIVDNKLELCQQKT